MDVEVELVQVGLDKMRAVWFEDKRSAKFNHRPCISVFHGPLHFPSRVLEPRGFSFGKFTHTLACGISEFCLSDEQYLSFEEVKTEEWRPPSMAFLPLQKVCCHLIMKKADEKRKGRMRKKEGKNSMIFSRHPNKMHVKKW